ncbi:FtsW/RodA/SpoVE family cell cycle protein [Leptolyngbya sp. PCC 6406]|uniref:FtsW/RodA/SpoVE family cell cycle protein n=1 Tax=Leptolyngbya sp. PCC 6406 TaxID=1173264 RepID=UPI0002AD01EB|nr:FtsW/RodA/SpoVE family cell cycle protein [Leptolyngbya sp. PCC 6406]
MHTPVSGPVLKYFFPLIDPATATWSGEARLLRWLTLLWLGIGLVALFSASYPTALSEGVQGWRYLAVQGLWIFLGLTVFNWIVQQPLERLVRLSGLGFLGMLGVLLLTLLPAVGITVNGATRWLAVGPFLLQPSELLKPFLILQAARVFGLWPRLSWANRGLWLGLFAFSVGVVLLQPNLSTATICGLTLWLIAWAAGLPLRMLGSTALGGMVVVGLSLSANAYQRERISAFLNPWADPMGSGYQLIQSLLAIASGGLWGSGFGFSQQKLFYLPIQYTDFIFAVYAEEFGFVGCCLLLLFLCSYATVGMVVAQRARSPLQRLTAIGTVVLLVGQALFNIAVTVGLVPTTGLPFPLFSYGGSSMVANLMMAALLVRVAREVNEAGVVTLPIPRNGASPTLLS